MSSLKISLDLDGTVCDFINPYLKKFGNPKSDKEITNNVQNVLKNNKDFWLNLPVINRPNFVPRQYTTARIIKRQWIKDYLIKELLPKAPIYQVPGYSISKYSRIKSGSCNVHVDDSISVFKDLNLKGIPCLLLDSPENQCWDEPVGRIYSLDKEEIEDAYHLFKDTIFPHFKEFIQ